MHTTRGTAPSGATADTPTQPVWDPLVRILHWSLVAGVATAWLTSDAGRAIHVVAGYAVAATVALRIVWGFVGSRRARFASFVRTPRAVMAYGLQASRRREPRYVGHNPLGACMIVLLLCVLVAISISGWLMTSDAFFGSEALEDVHNGLAYALLGLVAVHVAGALVTGRAHRENLVRAMLTGRKRAAAAEDVD